MNYETLKISESGYEGTLTCYEHSESPELPEKPRPALLVLPGGAYRGCSDREAEPVGIEFFNRGYNAYVLRYPCAPNRFPAALVVAAASMDTIRKRAKKANTNPDKVFAIGFSAGGHLCGTIANCPPDFKPVKKFNFKPNGVVLSYPVINEKFGHTVSHDNLLGDERPQECAWLNLNESVRSDNPPAFIWATASDAGVPAENSLSYALAYNKLGLKYELHVFHNGPHGLSLSDYRVCQLSEGGENLHVATWVKLADEFLRAL